MPTKTCQRCSKVIPSKEQKLLHKEAHDEALKMIQIKLQDIQDRREKAFHDKLAIIPAQIKKMKISMFMSMVLDSKEEKVEEQDSEDNSEPVSSEESAATASSQDTEEDCIQESAASKNKTYRRPTVDAAVLELPTELKSKKVKRTAKKKRAKITKSLKTPSTAQRNKCPKWLSTPLNYQPQSTHRLKPSEKLTWQTTVYTEKGVAVSFDPNNIPENVKEALRNAQAEFTMLSKYF